MARPNSEVVDMTGLLVKCDGLKIGSVELTTTDLAPLDGLTATVTELNTLAGVTAGTVTAGKAIVTTTSKHIDALVISDGGLALGAGAGTAVSATAANLNTLASVTAGTTTASKALVVDANKALDVLNLVSLRIGAAAGTAVTSTAAELNILTGVTATALQLNQAAVPASAAEVVTATNVIAATESGTTYFLNSATEFVSTLPAPALGLKFTFIVSAAPSGASYTVVTTTSTNIIKGVQLTAQDAGGSGDSGTADDTITFVDGQAVAGDRCDVISDGTSWFAYAYSKVLAGITFTQAS